MKVVIRKSNAIVFEADNVIDVSEGGVVSGSREIGYSACDISHWQPLPEPPTNTGNE
jgi:hypothetical protein